MRHTKFEKKGIASAMTKAITDVKITDALRVSKFSMAPANLLPENVVLDSVLREITSTLEQTDEHWGSV
jgi:hypothetical protein